MANYNVDIQVGIKGTSALDKFTKTVNALAEKTELVNKNFSKGIQNIARYEQNLNRAARTLKLARTGQQQETIAIKNFVKALGEANTVRERQERLIKKEIATQNAAKRVTSPGPTGFSRSQFGPALPPAMVQRQERLVGLSKTLKEFQVISEDIALNRLNIANKRIESERRFNQESEKGNRIARQKTAEFLKQQRLLLQMSRQYSGPIGPVASGATEFRRDKARRQRAQFIASGAPGVPVAGAQQALPAFRERGLQALNNSIKLNESQLRIETALNGQRQRGVRFLEAQSREEKRQLDLGIAGQRSNLIPGVSSGKAVPRTQHSRPIGPKPAGAGRGMTGGGNRGGQNLALGIGFPLLFGGGAGSVAGGALGSVGGMGGQVLGSAIGGIIDQTVANIAKLGQALNPLTADIGAVTAAAGESGTAFERLANELEEVAGKERALELATAQLGTVIGDKGVRALREFGEESSFLGNEFAKTLSQIAAAVADLVNKSGLLTRLGEAVAKDNLLRTAAQNTTDPELRKLREERRGIAATTSSKDLEAALQAQDDLIAARALELQQAEQLAIVEEARIEIAEKRAAVSNVERNLIEAKIELEESGLGITTETGFALAQKVIEQETYVELQNAINEGTGVELVQQNELLKILRLQARAQKEKEAEQAKAAREQEAREREAKRLQESIFNEDLKQLQIQSKINQLSQSDLEAIETQKQELELVLNAKINQVKLSGEDLSLQKERIDTLMLEASLRLAGLDQLEDQIELTKQLNELSAGAGFDVSAPFERNMKFSGGKSVLDTGLASFEEGAALAPLIEQEVQIDRILAKYPMIGEAASAAAGVVTLGVNEMINGTKSVEQVFSDFLKSIGDMLIQAAQQMIATYIAIGIAKMFAGMGSGGIDSFGGATPAAGAFTPGGSMPFPTFAEGGYVTGPTNALIGEGGEPEYVIPESKMRESMGRYSKGSRGNSVIPTSGGGGDASGGGTATMAPIDVRYTVERINSVDYVTADQFQAGMREAANSGAKQGEQRALSTLRQNTTQRRRIGI